MHEELISRLKGSFNLAVTQLSDSNGRGYRLRMYASWNSIPEVKHYQVQLCGLNPLTGEDAEADGVIGKFDFSRNDVTTGLLSYHGRFTLRCSACMGDGSLLPFMEHDINLSFPANSPYVKLSSSVKGGFTYVRLQSNCWSYCRDKIWLSFDGHRQRVGLDAQAGGVVGFYLPTVGQISLNTTDKQIEIR